MSRSAESPRGRAQLSFAAQMNIGSETSISRDTRDAWGARPSGSPKSATAAGAFASPSTRAAVSATASGSTSPQTVSAMFPGA